MDIELNEDPKDSFLKSLARFLQQRVDFPKYGEYGMSPKRVISWSFWGKNLVFPSSVPEIPLRWFD